MAGIVEVVLHRGMHLNYPNVPEGIEVLKSGFESTVNTTMQPMSSWSWSYNTAKSFAQRGDFDFNVVYSVKVPASMIMGSARTGFGCLNEFEFVLLDGKGWATVVRLPGGF